MEPEFAELDADTVSVLVTGAVVLAVTDVGVSEQVRPVVPPQDRLTVPVNPCNGAMLSVSVVVSPVLTVSPALPALI